MAYPRFQRARDFKFVTKSDGDFSVTSTTPASITGLGDIVLTAQVGDVIEVSANGFWSTQNVQGTLRVVSIVGGSPVSVWPGTAGWIGLPLGTYVSFGGSTMREVSGGDISSGTVTLRLQAWVSSGSRTLRAVSGEELHFWARNLGPKDPN